MTTSTVITYNITIIIIILLLLLVTIFIYLYLFICVIKTRAVLTVLWIGICLTWSQGRINHCAGCTVGGAPHCQGATRSTAKFLPHCFDV